MKKLTVLFFSIMLMLSLAGGAGAVSLSFTDTRTLNKTLGEEGLASLVWGDSFEYQHNTPGDFEVPYHTVEEATLSISGYLIDSDKNQVDVSGRSVGYLKTGGGLSWSTLSLNPVSSTYNIESVFLHGWSTGQKLNVTVNTNGDLGDGILKLGTSISNLKKSKSNAPVSEVSEVPELPILFHIGAGLLGLVVIKRTKFI
jgi:hypothetical protein